MEDWTSAHLHPFQQDHAFCVDFDPVRAGIRGGSQDPYNSIGSRDRAAAAAPAWLVDRETMRQLLDAAAGLFTPCPHCHKMHQGSRDSHVSFLDVDDRRTYCHFCRPSGVTARVVQVRRNTYNDVMRTSDLGKLYDISSIQQYIINNGKVIFLRPRPQLTKHFGNASSCYYCSRVLMDAANRYCSLECKLNEEDGLSPLTAAEIRAALAAGDNRKVKIPRRFTGTAAAAAAALPPMQPPPGGSGYDTIEQSDCTDGGSPGDGGPEAGCYSGQQWRRRWQQTWTGGGLENLRDDAAGYDDGDDVATAEDNGSDNGDDDGGQAVAAAASVPRPLGGSACAIWDEDDGGVTVAVTAAVAGGPWFNGRPVAGPVSVPIRSTANAPPALPPSIHRRPPRPPPPTRPAPQEGNARPQRHRQPPQRLSSPMAALRRPGGTRAPPRGASPRPQPLLDDEPASSGELPGPQRHSARLAAAGRANSAPLPGAPAAAFPGADTDPLLSLSLAAEQAKPPPRAGLGDYMLSLMRERGYCKPGPRSEAAAPELTTAEPGAAKSAFAAAAGWLPPPEAHEPQPQPQPQPQPGRVPVRAVSAGSGPVPAAGPNAALLLSGTSYISGGVMQRWTGPAARGGAASGGKRRCVSVDLGGGSDGSGSGYGYGQPEVTSPLRRRHGNRPVGPSRDDAAASLFSPSRGGRRRYSYTALGGGGSVPAAANGAAAGMAVDVALATLLSLAGPSDTAGGIPSKERRGGGAGDPAAPVPPRASGVAATGKQGRDPDSRQPGAESCNGAVVSGAAAVAASAAAAAVAPVGELRAKPRKRRPQQAPMV